ncbi:unnamed protein product, partial [Amoebophrya sp. A25]
DADLSSTSSSKERSSKERRKSGNSTSSKGGGTGTNSSSTSKEKANSTEDTPGHVHDVGDTKKVRQIHRVHRANSIDLVNYYLHNVGDLHTTNLGGGSGASGLPPKGSLLTGDRPSFEEEDGMNILGRNNHYIMNAALPSKNQAPYAGMQQERALQRMMEHMLGGFREQIVADVQRVMAENRAE